MVVRGGAGVVRLGVGFGAGAVGAAELGAGDVAEGDVAGPFPLPQALDAARTRTNAEIAPALVRAFLLAESFLETVVFMLHPLARGGF